MSKYLSNTQKNRIYEREKEKRKLLSNAVFPKYSLGATGLLAALGLGSYGAGKALDSYADLSFEQLQHLTNNLRDIKDLPGAVYKSGPTLKDKLLGIKNIPENVSRLFNNSQQTTPNDFRKLYNLNEDQVVAAPGEAKVDWNNSNDPRLQKWLSSWDNFIPKGKLKDYKPASGKELTKINDTVLKVLAGDGGELDTQLAYSEAGHRLLNLPSYGDNKAVDLVRWTRARDNSWWRSIIPHMEDTWASDAKDIGTINKHYELFAKSVPDSYKRLVYETDANEFFNKLMDIRQNAINTSRMSGGSPEVFKNSFIDQTTRAIAGDIVAEGLVPDLKGEKSGVLDILKNWVSASSGTPMFRHKAKVSATKLFDIIQNHLDSPDVQRAGASQAGVTAAALLNPNSIFGSALANTVGNLEGATNLASNTIYKNNDTHKRLLANALELPLDAANNIDNEAAKNKIYNLVDTMPMAGSAQSLDPTSQRLLLQKTLENKPIAQFFGAAKASDLPFPLGGVFYKLLSKVLSYPGVLANQASHLSPALRYGGLSAAGLAGVMGTKSLYDWWQNKQKAKRLGYIK